MLHPAIIVRNSAIQGSGLIADRLIHAGEILFKFDGTEPPAHRYEMVDWPPQKRHRFLSYACQMSEDDYCFGELKFINHSCDPTGWWGEDYGTITALRDIQPGEEMTYDYSTADITLSYQMKCRCGSDSCRGIVTNKDYLDPDFQKKYANYLPEHVLKAIKGAQSDGADSRKVPIDQVPDHILETVGQAKLKTLEFRIKFGDQYIYEMVRHVILQVRANAPEFRSKHGDKYIFDMVRELILKN